MFVLVDILALLIAILFGLIANQIISDIVLINSFADLHLYWSAFQAVSNQLNPYFPENLSIVQLQKSAPYVIATFPWSFVLLSPILAFSFKTAAIILLCLDFLAIYGLCKLLPRLFKIENHSNLFSAVVACTFVPIINLFLMGQLTLIITFFVVATFVALQKNKNILAGLLALPLTIKPHLIFLVIIFLAFWSLREKRFNFIYSFLSLFTLIAASAYIINPTIYDNWLNLRSSPLIWMGTTLSTPIRLLLSDSGQQGPHWPSIFIPSITAITFSLWLLQRKELPSLNQSLPSLICISLFTAPYGWLYDQSLNLIVLIPLVAATTASKNLQARVRVMLLVLFFQLISCSLFYFCMNWCFFWLPLAVLALWYKGNKILLGQVGMLKAEIRPD